MATTQKGIEKQKQKIITDLLSVLMLDKWYGPTVELHISFCLPFQRPIVSLFNSPENYIIGFTGVTEILLF